MGWGSGSALMENVVRACKAHVPDEDARQKIYETLIAVWQAEDCDTLEDVLGEDVAFDRAMRMLP